MHLHKPCTSLSASTLYSQLNSVFLVFPREYLDTSSANVTTCLQVWPSKGMQLFCSILRYCFIYSFCSYRAIPILPDLKEVMDWVFTDTSLKLFHWLNVQEIWAQLYIIKNKRKREKVCNIKNHNTVFY